MAPDTASVNGFCVIFVLIQVSVPVPDAVSMITLLDPFTRDEKANAKTEILC